MILVNMWTVRRHSRYNEFNTCSVYKATTLSSTLSVTTLPSFACWLVSRFH